MKKAIVTLAFALGIMNANAQKTEINSVNNFNKWSIEAGGGLSYVQKGMTAGFTTDMPKSYAVDLGARYMFNNKFGLKFDIGYNNFINEGYNSKFGTEYTRMDLQGVANLGRIMNFETWTNRIGLLGHAGFGIGSIYNDRLDTKDRTANFIAGVTGQIRLSNRIALTGDLSSIFNAMQQQTFDGLSETNSRNIQGLLFNATVGLQVYLGKNEKHADWVIMKESAQDVDLSAYDKKIADLENQIKNIPAKQTIVEKPITTNVVNNDKDVIKELINEKYYSVYFDFNKTAPIENSTAAIDVVLTYLRKNPSASLDIIGHADQVGKAEYNEKLSNHRAENIKTIFEKSGIASSRLNVVPAGADTSIQKESEEARRLARRVTFRVK